MTTRTLDTVAVTRAETRKLPEAHIVYAIEVSTKQKLWTVFRRYSDFDAFNTIMRNKYHVTSEFPPKRTFGNSNPEVIERRRVALERYLKTIVLNKEDRIANAPELFSFLEVEKNARLRAHERDDVSFETWVSEHGELSNLAGKISSHLASRDKLLRQGDNDAADGLEARRLYSLYVSKFQALATTLQSPNVLKELNITDQELLRRRNLMSEAKLEMTRLESWLKNPLLGGTSASRNDLFGSSAGGGGSSSSSSGGRQPRRFGPEETDETRKYDNDGLLQLAKQTIDVQDKSLDRLLQSVQRTKHVALAIGDELALQNEMLEDLNEKVEDTQDKLKRTGKKLIKTM